MPEREWHHRIEAALVPPTVRLFLPEEWVLSRFTATPVPASPAPQVTASIPLVVDEGRELGVRDRRGANLERLHLDLMRPLLVVEDEGLVGRGTEQESATRDVDVVRPICRIDRGIGRG